MTKNIERAKAVAGHDADGERDGPDNFDADRDRSSERARRRSNRLAEARRPEKRRAT